MGGAQYQAKLLVEHMSSVGGFETTYLTRRAAPDFRSQTHRVLLISDRKGLKRYTFALDGRSLVRALRWIQPHVIYQRVGCAHTGISAWYARRYGCRLVWHVAHDRTLEPFPHSFSASLPSRLIDHAWMIYGIRNATTIVAQTEWQQQQLMRRYGRRSIVIRNFHPEPNQAAQKPTGPLQVTWVANLKEWKRPEAFLQLAEDLREQPIEFHMVGKASPNVKLMNSLLRRINALANFTFHGERTQEQVNSLLSRSHLFVNTSDHEGFANTFVQAWLRAVPVATLRVNPDEVFNRQKVGFCADGDYGRLREWLRGAAQDRVKLGVLGQSALKYAREYHSMKNVERLESLFQRSQGNDAVDERRNGRNAGGAES